MGCEIQARRVFTTAELLGSHRFGIGPRRRVTPTCTVCRVHLVQLQHSWTVSRWPPRHQQLPHDVIFPCLSCISCSPWFHACLPAKFCRDFPSSFRRKDQLTFRSGYPWHLCHPSFRLRTRPLELALWLCIAKVEAFQPTRRPHPPPPPRARPCMGTYSPSFVDPSARSHRSLGVSPPWPHSCPWAFS